MMSMPPLVIEYFPSWRKLTVERRLFLQFFAGILLCANNGACFCFALFSDRFLYSPFSYSQSEISTIATVGVLLSYFSLPTGFLYDNKGPGITIAVGTFLNASGWLGLAYLFRSSEIPPRSLVSVILFYGLSQFSASFFETSAMLTNLKTFSCYKGKVVLIQKTFMGLGTSLAAQVFLIFFQGPSSISSFFVFLFIYSAVVGVFSFYFITLPTDQTKCLGLNVIDEPTARLGGGEPLLFRVPFTIGSVVLVTNVGIVLAMSLLEVCFEIEPIVKFFFGFLVIALPLSYLSMTLFSPNYTCNINGYKEKEKTPRVEKGANYGSEEPINADIFAELPFEEVVSTPLTCASRQENLTMKSVLLSFLLRVFPPKKHPYVKNNLSLWKNLRKRDIWVLWLSCFASWSAMTLVSSNSTQIHLSVTTGEYNSLINAVYVSVFGVGGAVGRIGVGLLHPIFERHSLAITLFTFVSPCVNVIGLPLFLFVPKVVLFLPYFLVGLSSGISWGSTVLVVTSFFTQSNCGKHYSFLYTAGMLSPIVFNTLLFGPLYDYYSSKQNHGIISSCEGVVCIWIPILVCFFLNLLVVPTSLYFARRTTSNLGL